MADADFIASLADTVRCVKLQTLQILTQELIRTVHWALRKSRIDSIVMPAKNSTSMRIRRRVVTP